MDLDNIQVHFSPNGLLFLNICLGYILFGIALNLTIADFKLILKQPKTILVGAFSQFIAFPFFTFLLVLLWKPAAPLALGMFLVAACPGGNISNYITHLSKGNTALSITLTAIATVLAIFFTPINFAFYASKYEATNALLHTIHLDFFDLLKSVFMLLAIPLCLGMIVRHYFPEFTKKTKQFFSVTSLIIFVGFLVVACVNNFDNFKLYIKVIVLLVLVHNLLGFFLGYLIAKLAKLDMASVKTITIETGIQNAGLGLVLIFNFFGGMGGMALIAAWWGIWHIIAGLILSTILRRKV
ncbi:MAG: bile acid:sodium symporter family protein [Chitinophagales bacterium]